MLGSKGILPPTIPDFSALRALEILKTFKIRSFFCKKWLLFHVLAGHKGAYSLLRASTTSQHDLLTLVSFELLIDSVVLDMRKCNE